MKEVYLCFKQFGYNIIEIYNPFNKDLMDVILFNEFNPDSSKEYILVSGVDVTEFLSKNMAYSRDNIVSFKTTFEAFLQKSTVSTIKYSKHYAYKVVS